MKLALLAGVLVALVAGCGSPAQPVAPTHPDAGAPAATAKSAPAAVADTYANLDAIAARGPTDAPLMRELMRVERAAPRAPDVRADRDLCLRALFAAPTPIRAWFADEAGGMRGEPATGATGSVPPRGPVCMKKGENLHLVVEGPTDTTARAVIFAAP